jgi:flagellar motor switch protein FliM
MAIAEAMLQNGKKVVKYDFRKPNKFGKDQMRTLHVVHEYYARLLTTYLSGVLRTYCHSELVSVEEQIFHEFNSSLPDSVILAVIEMPPLKGSILMEVSPSVAFGMLDYILGGGGGEVKEDREYTEIEIALLGRILPPMARLFADAWANVIAVDPYLDRIETNSRFIQVMSPNETIACITLRVDIGEINGIINICIPHISIQPFEDKLSNKFWFSNSGHEADEADQGENILRQLQDSSVEIKAILGETIITAGEVLGLQIGDVIQLNNKIREPIKLCFGNVAKLYGSPGLRNNKLAVRITGQIDEEADNE